MRDSAKLVLTFAAFFWLVFVAPRLAPAVAAGGDIRSYQQAVSLFYELRANTFNECRSVVRTSRRSPDYEVDKTLEIWVKGSKIRCDIVEGSQRKIAVINGDQYICRYTHGMPPTVGLISDFDDIWQHLGVVHPASIGASSKGFQVMSRGAYKPLVDANLSRDAVLISRNAGGGSEVAFKWTIDRMSPTRLKPSEVEHFERTGQWQYEEEKNMRPLKVDAEVTFSADYDNQLTRYYRSQLKGEMKTETLLSVEYELHPQISRWVPIHTDYSLESSQGYFNRVSTHVDEWDFSPIDDDIFTLNGLDLAEGTEVRNTVTKYGATRGTIVNGEARFPVIEQMEEREHIAKDRTPLTPRSSRFLMGLFIVAVSGLLFLAVQYHAKKFTD